MILIVGCGFLGSYLLRALSAQGEPVLVTVTNSARAARLTNAVVCDVRDPASLAALQARCGGAPLTVFYFAACHNVDYIYTHPEQAKEINLDGLERFLEIVHPIERLFFASTDCVYGENTPEYPSFPEDAPLLPVNVYGEQKKEAERIIAAHGFTSLRFSFMGGASLTGKPHFYDKLCASLRRGESVEMIDGMRRSVVSYPTAAKLLTRLNALPKDRLPGALNVCGDRALTKYQMGLEIADAIGADRSLIRPISEAEGQKFFRDARASSAAMDNARLKQLLHLKEVR